MEKAIDFDNAHDVVIVYTVAASLTGAIPVPASSTAIIAENGIMISHVSSVMGEDISISDVIASIGIAGSLNIVGRQIFIEAAKLLSWGTGNWWAAPLLVGVGASTAGIQTYIIGRISIEIAKKSGNQLSSSEAQNVVKEAKGIYNKNIDKWKKEKKSK